MFLYYSLYIKFFLYDFDKLESPPINFNHAIYGIKYFTDYYLSCQIISNEEVICFYKNSYAYLTAAVLNITNTNLTTSPLNIEGSKINQTRSPSSIYISSDSNGSQLQTNSLVLPIQNPNHLMVQSNHRQVPKRSNTTETDIINIENQEILTQLNNDITSNYVAYTVTGEALSKIGLDEIKDETYVVVYSKNNYKLMDVIYPNGVKYENETRYTLSNLQSVLDN